MSTPKKTIVILHLNPHSGMFYDQSSGLKLLPGQQIKISQDDIKKYKRIDLAVRHGHLAIGEESKDKTLLVFGNIEETPVAAPKKTDTPPAGKKAEDTDDEDDEDDEDDAEEEEDGEEDLDETEDAEDLTTLDKKSLIKFIIDNSKEKVTKNSLKELDKKVLLAKAQALQ